MLALAAVVHYQNSLLSLGNDTEMALTQGQTTLDRAPLKRFVYYTKKLPRFLRNQPSGNLFRALSLGMELVELSNDEYQNLLASTERSVDVAPHDLPPPVYGDSVWVPQGGACSMAVHGTKRLAEEIYEFWSSSSIAHQPLSVCFPGGTCSTALLVHRALQQRKQQAMEHGTPPLDIEVVVIPCVGDEAYSRRQMMHLSQHVFGTRSAYSLPAILKPAPDDIRKSGTVSSNASHMEYFHFGEPVADILQTFRELRDEYNVVVDLLYGAVAWTLLFRHWTSCSAATPIRFDPERPIDGRRVMYVHSGGLEGINSQLLRYKYKNLVEVEEIQLPGRNSPSVDG
jgi:1-aminocyclopropane-1-carboxylate deaminase